MRFKKILAAATSVCLAATSAMTASVMQAFAANDAAGAEVPTSAEKLVIDIRADETKNNEVTVDSAKLASSDYAIPLHVFVPVNPGVHSGNLKFQVNDGEEQKDGSFKNYGFTLSDAAVSDPNCFVGTPNNSEGMTTFNPNYMNISWVSSISTASNAEAAAEAGATTWSNPEWAYDTQYAFAEATLVVPKGTKAGSYVFDLREEEYINAVFLNAENKMHGKTSFCDCNLEAVDYESKPLTIIVSDVKETTTTTSTTTTETTTSTTTTETTTSTTTTETTTSTTTTETTTSTTTSETTTGTTTSTTATTSTVEGDSTTAATSTSISTTTSTSSSAKETTTTTSTGDDTTTSSTTSTSTSSSEGTTSTTVTTTSEGISTTTTTGTESTDVWKDSYKVLSEGMYWNIADVAGKAGDTVEVPIYVFGDLGTAGATALISYDKELTMKSGIEVGEAYNTDMILNTAKHPAILTFAFSTNKKAPDGSVLGTLSFTIPKEAKAGESYTIEILESYQYSDGIEETSVENRDTHHHPVKFIAGSVTVLASDTEVALNATKLNLDEAGQTKDLTIFNANGNVKWSSSDESVATVDENGFVTCVKPGNAVITATVGDKQYTCNISGGMMMGDVDNDGDVDADDATLTLKAYVYAIMSRPPLLDDDERARANITGDKDANGKDIVDASDATGILTYYVRVVVMSQKITWDDIIAKLKV